jgi:hypothetical protein
MRCCLGAVLGSHLTPRAGTALFIAAGSSVSISGSDTTRALDAW